jgi:recombination protein RecT
MSSAVAKAEPKEVTEANPQVTMRRFLETHRSKIAEAAANRVSPERLLRVALLAANNNPALFRCTQESLLMAIIQAAALGLEAGSALGEAYLVPYGDKCTLIVGYRGLIALARRSESIVSVEARPVFQGEHFRVQYGTDPKIDHQPVFDIDRTRDTLTAVYAVWTLTDGGQQFDVMSAAEVEAIRNRSRAKDNGPWKTDYVEMAKKTVIRRSAKLVPMSVELADAIDDDDRRELDEPVAGIGTAAIGTSATEKLKQRAGIAALPAGEQAAAAAPAPEPVRDEPAEEKPEASKAKAWSRFEKLEAKGSDRSFDENTELQSIVKQFPEFVKGGAS